MKIIIGVGHPKDVHTFKNLYYRLVDRGHQCLVASNDRQHNVELLRHFKMNHTCYSSHAKSLLGKMFSLVIDVCTLMKINVTFRADMFISHSSVSTGLVSFVFRKPHICIEDTFNMEQVRLSMPFTDVVLTGDYEHPSLGKKELKYPGYHELAYLHPNVFTPDERVLKSLGVCKEEKYVIVRFVAWAATHDIGHKGMSIENKRKLIETLSKQVKVFISSEEDLPDDLKKYQIPIKPEEVHSIMAYASLFVGESSTMATESAVLGVPAVYINDSHLGYIKDLESRGLIFSYTESLEDQGSVINNAIDIAKNVDKSVYKAIAERMLKDKIDVTAFLDWFVSNYPSSKEKVSGKCFSFDGFRRYQES